MKYIKGLNGLQQLKDMFNPNDFGWEFKIKEGNSMLRKSLITILAILFGVGIWVSNSQGKEYPIKPIEILCPYSAGSSVDIMIRLVAETAQKYLGQPLVVINKPGAGGTVAAAEIISSKPDGYKLIELTNFFFATTTKTQKVPFDPNDIVPLANFMEIKHGFGVKGDSPWKTLNDLLDYGRKNPGKLTWAHTGRGITNHMYGLVVVKKAGLDAVDVPYKGTPEQIAAVLGGHVDVSVLTYVAVRDLLKTGRLRYLCVFSNQRYSDLPNVPCVTELGFQEAGELPTLMGLYVHRKTPGEIMKTLIDAFKKVQEDPEFKKKFEDLGEQARFLGPELMKEAIKKAEIVGVPIIKELGLYVEQK